MTIQKHSSVSDNVRGAAESWCDKSEYSDVRESIDGYRWVAVDAFKAGAAWQRKQKVKKKFGHYRRKKVGNESRLDVVRDRDV